MTKPDLERLAAELGEQFALMCAEAQSHPDPSIPCVAPWSFETRILAALERAVAEAVKKERDRAMAEAAKDVCMYCAGRALGYGLADGPNSAGNWFHAYVGKGHSEVLCAASPIFARARSEEAKPDAKK